MSVMLSGNGGILNGRLGTSMVSATTTVVFNSANVGLAVKIFLPEAKTLSALILLLNARAGSGADLVIDIQTSSSSTPGTPSGTSVSGFTPQTWSTGSVTLNSPTLVALDAGNQVTLQAFTTYWLVLTAPSSTGTNSVTMRASYALQGNGSNAHQFISKTAAAWASSATTNLATAVLLRFSDGSEYGQAYGAEIITTPPYTLYSTRGLRVAFTPTVHMLCDGFEFRLSKITGAGDLTYILRDASGTALFTGSLDANGQASSATVRQYLLPITPIWLLAGLTYTVEIASPTVSTSSAYWTYSFIPVDAPATDARKHLSTLLNIVPSTTTNGSTWADASNMIVPFAISVISIGDFTSSGEIVLDSTVRDGASGSSLRLRAHTDLTPYSYWRYYVAAETASKTYSIKMRRSATAGDQPTLQRVELQRNGVTLATLNADASANGAWATYTTSAIALTAGDVVQIIYSVQLAAGQVSATQGLGWFDTEGWA